MMNNNMELNLDELKTVTGGDGLRDDPLYNAIKEAFMEKGIRTASAMAQHYYDDDKATEMIKLINAELGQGAERVAENNF